MTTRPLPIVDHAAANDAAQPTYACGTSVVYCRYAATAPHGCGLVALQVVRDARGTELYRHACTFCPSQRMGALGS
jgi:hypothetical protein